MKSKVFLIITFTVSLLFFSQKIMSQCATHSCNPQLVSVGFTPGTCVPQNDTRNFELGWFMNSTGPTCLAPAGSWRIQISLPLSNIYGANTSSLADIDGPGFTWEYNDANKTFNGINNIPMNRFSAGIVQVTVKGNIVNSCANELTQSNLFIVSNIFGGCQQAFNNNTSDDALAANLGVQSPLPIELSRFSARNGGCGEAIIEWETASERNSDYVDVERSEDGLKFFPVHKEKSNNQNKPSTYSYIDNSVLGGKNYYYRLKQVDFDGKTIHFNITSLRTNFCSNGDLSISLHPNPATEKVFVSLEGFNQNDDVSMIVTNAIGEQVMVVKNALTNEPNELRLNNLPAGIYNVKISGFDEVTSKRFIKID